MSPHLVVDIASWILLTAGGVFVFIGGVGALRWPDLYMRMHSASLTDTLGTILVLLGLLLQAGPTLAAVKLFAIIAFLLLTAPTAGYALANAARLSGPETPDDSGGADAAPLASERATSTDPDRED